MGEPEQTPEKLPVLPSIEAEEPKTITKVTVRHVQKTVYSFPKFRVVEPDYSAFEIVCLVGMLLVPLFAIGYVLGRRFAKCRRREGAVMVNVPLNTPRMSQQSPRYSAHPRRSSILPLHDNDPVALAMQETEVAKCGEVVEA